MKEVSVPVYYRIYKELKQRIARGTYPVKLPTEKKLCDEFNVSRLTLRRALEELKRESIIEASKGRGTFVLEEKREEKIGTLTGFTEEAKRDGRKATSLVLKNTIVAPEEDVAGLFEIPSGGMVVALERVRYLDEEPYGIERAFLNPMVDIRILNVVQRDMSKESLYYILKSELGIVLDHAQETIEVCRMSRDEARHLQVKEGSYAITRERHTYTDHGFCVEIVKSVYRGDRYRLKVVRRVE